METGHYDAGNARWTSWFTGTGNNHNATSNGEASSNLSESILKRSLLAGRSEGNSNANHSGVSVASHATSSSSSRSQMSGESTEEEHLEAGHGRNVHDEQEQADVDADSLMWEAQMALISHEYKSAMRKLKRAVRHGSAAACLSLGNILVKGLSCKDHLDHYTIHANPTEAAEYYIQGLEYLYQRDQQARQQSQDAEEDQDNEEERTPLLGSEDMETLQDLSTGLCSLYRLGRLRPLSEDASSPLPPSSSPTPESKGKQKQHDGIVDEKEGLSAESDRRLTLWDRGGTVSQSLIPRVQPLLGYIDLQEPPSPSCETPRPHLASRNPSSDSTSTTQPTKLKKSVSFTRLPPKHKSSLDPIATRQARACLIHLYYISALVSFAAHSHEGKSEARKAWERILYINDCSRGNGGGSKEADELVQKAKIRLEMLKDPAQAIALHINGNGNGKENHQSSALKLGKLDIPEKAKDLTIQHMLSPPVTAAEHTSRLEGFTFVPVNEKQRMEKPRLNGIRPRGSSRNPSTRSVSQASEKDDTFLPSVQNAHNGNGLEPPTYSRNHSSTSAASSRKNRPKFSISDSPTSTIRSYASVKGHNNSTRSRANSNASVLSGVIGGVTKSRAGGTALEAPWLLRRVSSSTSLSIRAPDLPADKQAHTQSRAKAQKPVLISKDTPSESKWAPKIRTATVSTTTSDISLLSPLSGLDLRKNSTSVASLPHLSTRFDNGKRSQSVSHLLFHRSNGRNGSTTSLSSLGMGIQKSFSSLKNFFLPAQDTHVNQGNGLSTVNSDDEEDEERASERDDQQSVIPAETTLPGKDLEIVREKLKKAAQRHDEALAEYQYWEEVDAESQPADSWNSPIQSTLPLLDEDENRVPLPTDKPVQEQPIPTTPPRPTAPTMTPSSSSPKFLFPLPRSLPSDRMVPTMAHLQPQAPPGTPVTPARRARKADKRAFGSVDITSTPRPSSNGSSPVTPPELDENGEIPGPLKIDPLLAALEAASRVNVKTRCAVCAKSGVNFPKARDGRTYCSRECRMSAREEAH